MRLAFGGLMTPEPPVYHLGGVPRPPDPPVPWYALLTNYDIRVLISFDILPYNTLPRKYGQLGYVRLS